jgi:transposase
MINIRHILRLHTNKVGNHSIIMQTGIPRRKLRKYIKDFDESGLSFEEIDELTDKDLEDLFTKPDDKPVNEKTKTLYNMFPAMDRELRHKGVTLTLLWQEYKKKYPDGYMYRQFINHFTDWKSQASFAMRKEHKAGDKMFIDFAGEKLSIIDKATGTVKPVEVFVAILGASQLTYVEAMASQQKEDFIPACENALHYYGGVPAAIVCDNLKSAVIKSSRYEPTINETFSDFAEHYNTVILPARAYKPKDKAPVENVIKIIYTRIYAKLRGTDFFSLEELNTAIGLALEEHNNELLTGKDYSRRQQFNEMEQHTLMLLPVLRYEFKKQHYATVMKYGHVPLPADKHYYSVPYTFIGKKVKVMYSRYNVEVYYEYERIAAHVRSYTPYKYTIDKSHLHPSHRFIDTWGPDRFILQAEEIHNDVKLYVSKILCSRRHPEQAYKICMGVLGFAKKFGNERLAKACQRAMNFDIYNYRIIKKILENGLDKQVDEPDQLKMPQHNNIRGKEYYK